MIKLLQPPGWAPPKGYANGIAARGTMVFVGGQIGWNAQQQFESDDFIEQTGRALRNIADVLRQAGVMAGKVLRSMRKSTSSAAKAGSRS